MHLLLPSSYIFSILLFACITAGCTDSNTKYSDTYLSRLAGVVDKEKPNSPKLANIPVKRPNTATEEPLTIGILQLAKLNHCELSSLIAEHNNQLGKTATATNRFIYHVKFIQAATSCIEHPDTVADSKELLRLAKLQKQQQLTHYFDTMLTQEPVFKRTWQLTTLDVDETSSGSSEELYAWSYLAAIRNKILSREFDSLNIDELHTISAILDTYRYSQKIVSAARLQIASNRITTSFLQRIDLTTLCAANKNSQKATILHNIFQKFYLKQLQHKQAFLTGKMELLLPMLNTIWRLNENDSLIDSMEAKHLLTSLKQSAKQHVQWWQGFYKQCEISPI